MHDQIRIPEADILLHAGDFTSRGYGKEVKKFINHDHYCQQNKESARVKFAKHKCHLLIDEELILANGLKVYGTPWSPWFHDWAFNLPRRDKGVGEIAKACWAQIPADTDILLVHGPPHKMLDRVDDSYLSYNEEPHAGCPQLLERIKEIEPELVVCGHVHEGHGANHSLMPATMVINASICTLDYKPTNHPMMVYL
jgi:Icc-related predicted phosphoesterase